MELGGSEISEAETFHVIKDFVFTHLSHKRNQEALTKACAIIFITTSTVIFEPTSRIPAE